MHDRHSTDNSKTDLDGRKEGVPNRQTGKSRAYTLCNNLSDTDAAININW